MRANPFAPAIEWRKHQFPEFWSNILSHYGFINPKILRDLDVEAYFSSFSGLRKISSLLFGNQFAYYFLTSAFLLVMDRSVSENLGYRARAITAIFKVNNQQVLLNEVFESQGKYRWDILRSYSLACPLSSINTLAYLFVAHFLLGSRCFNARHHNVSIPQD